MEEEGNLRPTRRIAPLLKLRPVDLVLIPRILALLAALLVLQRRGSLPHLAAFFDAPPRTSLPDPARRDARLDRIDRLTKGLLRRFFGPRFCMKRSLILFRFMRRYGLPARIHFGVSKTGDALHGHAWLDLDGQPYGEAADSVAPFRSIYVYPPAPAR